MTRFARAAGEWIDGDPLEWICPDCELNEYRCQCEPEKPVCLTCESDLTDSGFCVSCEGSGLPETIEERSLGNGWHRWAA